MQLWKCLQSLSFVRIKPPRKAWTTGWLWDHEPLPMPGCSPQNIDAPAVCCTSMKYLTCLSWKNPYFQMIFTYLYLPIKWWFPVPLLADGYDIIYLPGKKGLHTNPISSSPSSASTWIPFSSYKVPLKRNPGLIVDHSGYVHFGSLIGGIWH